jgi:hypothetical protein
VAKDFRFTESSLWSAPLRDLGLSLAGTALVPVIGAFERELDAAGIRRVRPRYYLSTEWGVPFETVAIAIPFYLARPDLTAFHRERTGLVEGATPAWVLRYLRHEMGHVVNYAYRLFERQDWVERFGSMTQPYEDEYRPEPFSRRYVVHLPGWYAQKHPDEDWAETFAVWLTPDRDWRTEYADWPGALAKLEYCDRVLAGLGDAPPLVTADEPDEDVGQIALSVGELYGDEAPAGAAFPPGLDGALRTIFEADAPGERRAATLVQRLLPALTEEVYRWTGHFPERTRVLVRHVARRTAELGLSYAPAREEAIATALVAFVTALAMNHVTRGSYLP